MNSVVGNMPFFIINKERFEVNRVPQIPKPQVDIYSKKRIFSKYQVNLIKDPIAHDLQSKQVRWSLSDLKIFFEKYLIYDRSEFKRIASFIP